LQDHPVRLQRHIARRYKDRRGSGNDAYGESQARQGRWRRDWSLRLSWSRIGRRQRAGWVCRDAPGTATGDGVEAKSDAAAVNPLTWAGSSALYRGGRDVLPAREILRPGGPEPEQGKKHQQWRENAADDGGRDH
jgi:hypothetical protein